MHPYWNYVRPAISLIIKVSADDHSYHLRINSTKLGFIPLMIDDFSNDNIDGTKIHFAVKKMIVYDI